MSAPAVLPAAGAALAGRYGGPCALGEPTELGGSTPAPSCGSRCPARAGVAADDVWSAGLLDGCAAWVVATSYWLIPSVLGADRSVGGPGVRSPGRRAYVVHRLSDLADQAEQAGRRPVLAGYARAAAGALRRAWQVGPLGRYPAFADVP